ncbi:tripartite tricarboxylate transporter TctB family protein [Rhizobiaceae bacterium BDR2-2]|uniref:Tripartite tricarboxylate transporter TctB family protein n=1 Tax=Ectorhizobium quercum TaxID=2965071 RepID=A0AAE3MYR7_9HYPH|nr:tripartite tricarboxylate transporter TctB family protein [Ectorhizobium quercum]MCX8997429.1 tripartite tricarboxylate transporter TctB family protein [Ectorhizobium quercum]
MINRDICCGVLFILIGVLFGYQALFHLQLGTLRNMGPGFFPAFLSGVAIVIGLSVAVSGIRQGGREAVFDLPWRAIAAILAGPLIFGIMIAPFGLVPSILVLAIVAAGASRKTSPLSALTISVVMTAFCTVVFTFGLGIPIPLFGPLLVTP